MDLNLSPSWPQVAPNSPPSWPHFGPLGTETVRKGMFSCMFCHPSCSHALASLGPSWGHLGSNFASISLRLGLSCLHLGFKLSPSWPHLAPNSLPSWPHFAPPGHRNCEKRVPFIAFVATPAIRSARPWNLLILGICGPSCGHLGATLAPCWLQRGPDLAHLGTCGAQFETIAGPFLGPLGLYCRTAREPCRPSLRASCPISGLASLLQALPGLDAPSLGGGMRSAWNCCDGRGSNMPFGNPLSKKGRRALQTCAGKTKSLTGVAPLGNFYYANKMEAPI